MWRILLIALALFYSLTSQAITLNDPTQVFDLVNEPLFYKEPAGASFSQMLSMIESGDIAKLQAVDNLGYVAGAYWLFYPINNQSNVSQWTLHFGDTLVEKLDLFILGNQYQHRAAYYPSLSTANRTIPTGVALNFTVQSATQVTLVLRMEADLFDQTATIKLMTRQQFEQWAPRQLVLYLLLLGGILAFSLYSLLLYIISQDVSYGWYSAMSLLISLYILSLYGYLYPLFDFQHINRFFDYSILAAFSILLLVFVYRLLDLNRLPVWLGRLLISLGVISVLSYPLSFFVGIETFSRVVSLLVTLSMWVSMLAAAVAIRNHQTIGWFLVFSWAPLFVVWTVSSWLTVFSRVAAIGFNIELFTYVAVFIQFLILLLAVVNKINLLQQQALLAESLSHEKSRFIAAASHDLRQPLHSMGLFIGLLEEHVRVEGEKLLGHIKTSLSAANNLFNEALDLSRLEAGMIKPEITSVELDRLFDQLCHEFNHQAENKGIYLRYRPTRLWVLADSMMLERILRNLINNAICHTQQGGVLMTSRLRQGRVSLECWDTGKGIACDQLSHIFTEFKQIKTIGLVDNIHTGVGLGLSIVKQFADLLDVELRVDSRPGRGTVFRLLLPRGKPVSAKIIEDTQSAQSLLRPVFGCQVWLLDNDAVVLEAMQATLTGWGCQVLSAQSWLQLQQLINGRSAANLLVVDLDLEADEDGFDVIQELRKSFPDISVVVITGNTNSEVINSARKNRIPLLFKPLNTLKLRYLLQQL